MAMGIKRWLLALLILVVVLGFIAFIFLQSGADKQIAEVVIPKIEQKFGVSITYDDVSVSLTSVSFDNVRVSPLHNNRRSFPFAAIERLGVNFRVGPLLLGDLDITGVRVDGLHILIGKQANGASIESWHQLIQRLRQPSVNKDKIENDAPDNAFFSLRIPEIYVVSGDILYNDSRFLGNVEELSGRITPGNKAMLQAERWGVGNGKFVSFKGNHLDLSYDFSLTHLAVDLDKPEFSIPTKKKLITQLITDVQKSLSELGLTDDTNTDATEVSQDEASALDVVVKIHSASGSVMSGEPNKLFGIRNMNAELLRSNKAKLSVRASGGLSGTDARWALQGTLPRKGLPSVVIEVPDFPLKHLGVLLGDKNPYVDLSKAIADGQLKMTLVSDGTKVEIEGQTSVSGANIAHGRISSIPIEDFNSMFDYKITYDIGENVLHLDRVRVSQDMARVTFRGDIQLNHLGFDLKANVPATSCRQIFSAIPVALRTELEGVELEGRLGLDMHFAFDIQNPDATVLDATLDNRCKISKWGRVLHPDDLRRPFAYMAYDRNGQRIRLRTGPGTSSWTPLGSISPFLLAAVLTTEDGKFEFHKGVTLPEIRRAFLMNYDKDGMFHGGSTITMQLAKNLFLSRERTVARKLQELFFVWYLESNFTKDEILELYFNVIEFGPSLYGIGEAAFHYFGRDAHELNLLESIFLIKLLPNPIERHKVWENGKLSERKLKSLQRVMATMTKRKRITGAEYQEGLRQNITFYKEGMPLPEPRIPVHRLYNGGEGYYEEEDTDFEQSQDDAW